MRLKSALPEVKAFVFDKLTEGLDPRLYYHDVNHTLDDIYPAALRLAEAEGVTGEYLYILLTGALFHDIGYIYQYRENEPIAAKMAAEVLPEFGYTADQIEVVRGLILATRIPQEPNSLIEEILCDADLDSLGREDFFILSLKLRTEYSTFSEYIGLKDWFGRQLAFLESHRYFTNASKMLRDEGKRKNIEELRSLFDETDTRP